MKRSLWLVILAVIMIVALSAWRISTKKVPTNNRKNSALVKVEIPKRMDVVYSSNYTGDVLPIQQANIFSKVNGNIEKILADIGDQVREGQLLAVIDSTELYQQYLQSLAVYNNNKSIYERNRELISNKLVSKAEFDNTEANYRTAEASYQAAKLRLGYTRIVAPFSGTIVKKWLDAGSYVASGNSTLFTVMDLSTMKVAANVLEKDLAAVKIGMNAEVAVDAFPGRKFAGTIKRFADALDPATRTMITEIRVANPDRALKPGMFARIDVISGKNENAIVIPSQALLKSDAGYYLFKVVADTARRQMVKTGREMGLITEIVAGIDDSTKVITVGVQFARDGGKVTVQR